MRRKKYRVKYINRDEIPGVAKSIQTLEKIIKKLLNEMYYNCKNSTNDCSLCEYRKNCKETIDKKQMLTFIGIEPITTELKPELIESCKIKMKAKLKYHDTEHCSYENIDLLHHCTNETDAITKLDATVCKVILNMLHYLPCCILN